MYLQFLTKKRTNPFGDYFQMNFTYVLKDSLEESNKILNLTVKTISIRITGREDASLRGTYSNYELDPAFFTIANKYIIDKIENGEQINEKEEVFSNSLNYLNLDIEPLEEFHTEEIKVLSS
ncbi:MAG: hypothetical protein A2254_14405 [Ignavibacteria bacterium RIFOXYA2_FULL_35_9]|nr:MAG: hypothetical protein A2254_14405 [Ignavibacteria bacterium RIFOXYA2_FULL_35_9]